MINMPCNYLLAEKYYMKIKGANIDFIMRLLRKADKKNSPRIVINSDGSKSLKYKKNNLQKELTKKELLFLTKYPLNYANEQKFIKETLVFLNNIDLSIVLSKFKYKKGSAYWFPKNKIIKIDIKTINSGSLTFARILNHEMIHVAQSCKGGSYTSLPVLIGGKSHLTTEKKKLLSSKLYRNLSKYEISLEKEAYSYQDDLNIGRYLIEKFCL